MIYLTKGQTLFDNTSMVVYDPTGYYEDGASVICASTHAPEDPICRYEAKFIAYGNLVYNITEPEKLTEEILKIDPKSLFGKNNKDVALDAVVENIKTVDSTLPTDTPVTTQEEVTSALSSSTPTVINDTQISTTTPSTIEPSPIIEAPVEQTIEEIVPVIENVIEDLTKVSNVIEGVSSTTPPLSEITF